jgi:hypothetical protein
MARNESAWVCGWIRWKGARNAKKQDRKRAVSADLELLHPVYFSGWASSIC